MAGSFSSIKKSKKSNNAKLPKQPQRGLGVAQLEKIRMQRQIAEFIDPSMQSPFLGNSQQVLFWIYIFYSFFFKKNYLSLQSKLLTLIKE